MFHISVQRLRKDENKYYEDLLEFGWKNLLLFPYHLSDIIIKKLSVTPFHYYINMLDSQMAQEKSYDSLPNFTAGNYVYYFILFYSYRYLRAVRKLCRLGRAQCYQMELRWRFESNVSKIKKIVLSCIYIE